MNLRKLHFIKLLCLSKPVFLFIRKVCLINYRLPTFVLRQPASFFIYEKANSTYDMQENSKWNASVHTAWCV